MTRIRHYGGNLAVVAVFVLLFDGFMYRDPHVELPHGYSIGAISGSSPCMLGYSSYRDDRKYSDWMSMADRSNSDSPKFRLVNSSGAVVNYETENEWRAAIAEKMADPREIAAFLPNVTRYQVDGDLVIGIYQDGYFLLNTRNHDLETWQTENDWRKAVAEKTNLGSSWLKNPKSRWNRTRFQGSSLFYLFLLILAVVWSETEYRRSRTALANGRSG